MATTGSRTKRIVNGFEAELKQFPYMVLLRFGKKYGKQPWCTSFLISEQSVLTAAHCVVSKYSSSVYPTEYLDGILGSVSESDTRNRVTFREFHVHEIFDYSMTGNDIAILILEKAVEMSDYIKTIALPKKGMRFDGEDVVAVGWGKYKFGKEYRPYFLRFMETRVSVSDKSCSSRSMSYSSNKNVCLEQKEEICVFKGDSGGPLVKKSSKIDVSIGVLSFGFSTETCRVPAAYMSTSAYYDWIEKNAVGNVTFVNSF